MSDSMNQEAPVLQTGEEVTPGKVHEHNGRRVYHRADGGLVFHGRRHSEYSPEKDRKHHTNNRPEKAGYPHAGDGIPVHIGIDSFRFLNYLRSIYSGDGRPVHIGIDRHELY